MEASLGGVRRHVFDLIRGLHFLGVPQGLAYSPLRADSGCLAGVDWATSLGIPAFPLPMQRRIAPISDSVAAVKLLGIVKRFNPIVLHLHSSKAGGIGRMSSLISPNAKVVYTPHGTPSHISRRFGILEKALGWLRTDGLIAVSESEYDELRSARYVPERHLFRVDSGIDASEVIALAEAYPAPVSLVPVIVTVGRISPQKNPLFVADVAREVLLRYPSARFEWIGDGELRGEFDRRLAQLGIADSWHVSGWTANPFPRLRRASVFLLASDYESFGYATLEAMTLGRPAVVTNVAGSRDLVVDGKCGFVVERGNVRAFAAAIVRLLRSDRLAEQFGAAARVRAIQFSIERMARQTYGVYQAVMA